jgi:1-acyl-sn-glycerol-3-phosphate acyltransferase
MKIIFRALFTLWAYFTFVVLMLVVFLYHVGVVIFTRGNRVELMYRSYRPWALAWAFLNGVRLEVKGREKIEKNKSYIFVINHGSTGDIVIVASSMIWPYRPLGKKELTSIPVMGYMFQRAVILVDRSDAESRRLSMERMREVIRQHISIMIAPEGTRNRTHFPLQPFKDGAFRLATEFQLPVVPMVLLNTRVLYPNDSLLMNHCTLKCHFLDPIPTAGMTESDVPALKEKVFKLMEDYVKAHDALFTSRGKAAS